MVPGLISDWHEVFLFSGRSMSACHWVTYAVMNMKVEISRSNAYIPKEVTSDPFAILIG